MNWQKDFLISHNEYKPSNYLIAFSGGRDSVALFHALVTLNLNVPIKAIYINHGWSDLGRIWGDFCVNFAEKYGICCQVVHLNLSATKNAEATARSARYKVFEELLSEKSVLLTAHHQNDQAETFMLQLMRSAGLSGLAAMPYRKKFGSGEHWRPLLNISREEINQYLNLHQLPYVDDPSNDNSHYQRNLWRNEIFPVITNHYPHFVKAISRSTENLALALQLQQKLTFSLLKELKTFPFSRFSQQFGDKLAKTLLREWLNLHNASMPPSARLDSFNAVKNAELIWDCWHLQHYRGELYLYPNNEIAPPPKIESCINWSGIGKIFVKNVPKNAYFALYPQSVYFHEKQALYKTSLKNFFQNKGINPFLRRRLPMIICEDECIWLGNFGNAKNWEQLSVEWIKSNSFF